MTNNEIIYSEVNAKYHTPEQRRAILALALIRAQRFQLATFQHGTACAGGAPSGAFLSRRRRGQILHLTGVRSRCRALT